MWIKALNTYIGAAGSFLAGQAYDVTEQTLAAIEKAQNIQRSKLPKEQRESMSVFKYEQTAAPWDAQADQLTIDRDNTAAQLAACRQNIANLAAEVERLKVRLEKRSQAIAKLEEMPQDELDAPPVKFHHVRETHLLAADQAELDLIRFELAENEKAENELAEKLAELQLQIAKRNSQKSQKPATEKSDKKATAKQ